MEADNNINQPKKKIFSYSPKSERFGGFFFKTKKKILFVGILNAEKVSKEKPFLHDGKI